MKFITKLTVSFVIFSIAFTSVVLAADTTVDPFQSLCKDGREATKLCQQARSSTNEANSNRGLLGPNGIITKATQFIIYATGAISVIMVIIGGFKYTLSAGDSNATSSAKNTIMYSIIGLVVAILAQVIVSFILSRL
jgi:hypothetical protein